MFSERFSAKPLQDVPSIPGAPWRDFTFLNAFSNTSVWSKRSYKLYQTRILPFSSLCASLYLFFRSTIPLGSSAGFQGFLSDSTAICLFCSRLLQRNSLPPARLFPSSPRATCQPPCSCLPPLKSHPVCRRNFQVNSTPSHPADAFGHRPPPRTSRGSIRFYPPHPHGLSQAESSTLLRAHLPPCTFHPIP